MHILATVHDDCNIYNSNFYVYDKSIDECSGCQSVSQFQCSLYVYDLVGYGICYIALFSYNVQFVIEIFETRFSVFYLLRKIIL